MHDFFETGIEDYMGREVEDYMGGQTVWEPPAKEAEPPAEPVFLSIEELVDKKLQVGADNRIYRTTQGAITARVPCPVTQKEDFSAILEYDETRVPPLSEVRWLFDEIMRKYDREVWMWVSQDREDPTAFYYIVPKQEGTGGSVEIKDSEKAFQQLCVGARFVGTIHTHPGTCAQPSNTDLTEWAKPGLGGLHYILARDRSYTLNACVAGLTWGVKAGSLPEEAEPAVWSTEDNLELSDVLLEPKYGIIKGFSGGGIHHSVKHDNEYDFHFGGGLGATPLDELCRDMKFFDGNWWGAGCTDKKGRLTLNIWIVEGKRVIAFPETDKLSEPDDWNPQVEITAKFQVVVDIAKGGVRVYRTPL